MGRTKRYEVGGDVESDYGPSTGRGAAGTFETTTAPKPKVVTKEELEKSGLSLRDYMNKQQGLTRRGESSTTSMPKAEESAPVVTSKAPNTLTAEEYKAALSPAKSKETYRSLSGEIKTKKSEADRDAENAAKREKVSETFSNIGSSIRDLGKKAIENYKSTVPRYNKEKKMSSGGKVSSASRRGDGIASKGHTRGRYL